MSRKRRGKKGSGRMHPKLEWTIYPLIFSIILTVPVWAFSPFDQELQISWMIGTSITLFGLYGYDKGQAKGDGRRIPELNLHMMSLLGGFLGGLVGMFFFRHKTRKTVFYGIFIASAILHAIIFMILP